MMNEKGGLTPVYLLLCSSLIESVFLKVIGDSWIYFLASNSDAMKKD